MEELNQVQTEETVEMPDSLFGDDDATAEEMSLEDVQEQSQDTPVEEAQSDEEQGEEKEEEAEQTQETEAEPQSFLTITYNKQQKGLTQDEAIEYAQKGMNYDKLHDMYETLKEREPLFDELNRLAQMNSMSTEDYLKNLSEVQTSFEISQEVESLREKYPDSDEEVLTELATQRVTDRKQANQQSAMAKEQESVDSRKQEISRQLDVFEKRYPDTDPSKLDPEVYELMKTGFTLLEAYESVNADKRRIEQQKRESEEKINRINEENKKKSLGNINTQGDVERNDFLSAFWSSD